MNNVTGAHSLKGNKIIAQGQRSGRDAKRKMATDRLSRALKSVAQWCRTHRHRPMREQWEALSSKQRGH